MGSGAEGTEGLRGVGRDVMVAAGALKEGDLGHVFMLKYPLIEARIVWKEPTMDGPEHLKIPDTREELEAMLLEGLNSGPGIVMNDAEWQRLHDEIEADAHAERRAS